MSIEAVDSQIVWYKVIFPSLKKRFCFAANACTHDNQVRLGTITLFRMTEVCFLSPQYHSRGVKVETPAQTDSSPRLKHQADDNPSHRRYGVSHECQIPHFQMTGECNVFMFCCSGASHFSIHSLSCICYYKCLAFLTRTVTV